MYQPSTSFDIRSLSLGYRHRQLRFRSCAAFGSDPSLPLVLPDNIGPRLEGLVPWF